VPANAYRGYRFPEEIISQCVWLYFNFAVSLREVELMMAYRGIQLSYETIRRWCETFGASYAAKLKRRRPKLGDKMVPGRSVLKDQRSAVLPLACSRPARRRH
jgi:putative transposase